MRPGSDSAEVRNLWEACRVQVKIEFMKWALPRLNVDSPHHISLCVGETPEQAAELRDLMEKIRPLAPQDRGRASKATARDLSLCRTAPWLLELASPLSLTRVCFTFHLRPTCSCECEELQDRKTSPKANPSEIFCQKTIGFNCLQELTHRLHQAVMSLSYCHCHVDLVFQGKTNACEHGAAFF